MKTVQAKEAKESFSALIDAAGQGRPTMITRHGVPVAVLTPIADARKICRVGFLSGEIDVPADFNEMRREEIEQLFVDED